MLNYHSVAAPVGRVLISLLFLVAGLGKIAAYHGTQSYMEAKGVPGSLLPVTILFEVGFSLAIIIGWQTRLVALAMAGFSLITAAIFHSDFSNEIQFIMFMKNVAIAGGFLFLVAHGAGAFSLDHYFSRRRVAGQ
ncbi:MAG: DoxX family protein [Alphaproteobacteria bacterium]|nr:DoxX family protein [Alphaproteobacteria bacterium]